MNCFRYGNVTSGLSCHVALIAVTVADYANADPAIVKSGRLKKAVANAFEKKGKR